MVCTVEVLGRTFCVEPYDGLVVKGKSDIVPERKSQMHTIYIFLDTNRFRFSIVNKIVVSVVH